MPLQERDHAISSEEKKRLIENLALQKTHVKHRFHAGQVRKVLSDEKAVEFVVEKGADDDGNEVVILTTFDAGGTELGILERGVLCPPICG